MQKGSRIKSPTRRSAASGTLSRRNVAMAAVLALVLGSAGAWWLLTRAQPAPPAVQREPVSVLVSDFVNGTGDPLFDRIA